MSNSIIDKFVSTITNKQQQAEEYKPNYMSKTKLSRLRADIVGIAASIRYEKFQEKKGGKCQELHQLIKSDLKASARAKLIAYSLLRGKSYKDVENSERAPEWWKSWEFNRLVRVVADELVKHAWTTKDRQWFNDPANIKKMMGAPTDG